jgi:hypothetical protein
MIAKPSGTIRSLHTLLKRLTGLETENLETHREVKWQYFQNQVSNVQINSIVT